MNFGVHMNCIPERKYIQNAEDEQQSTQVGPWGKKKENIIRLLQTSLTAILQWKLWQNCRETSNQYQAIQGPLHSQECTWLNIFSTINCYLAIIKGNYCLGAKMEVNFRMYSDILSIAYLKAWGLPCTLKWYQPISCAMDIFLSVQNQEHGFMGFAA